MAIQVISAAGYGTKGGLGERPALLVVDMTYNFCGDKAEPVLASIKARCGASGKIGSRQTGSKEMGGIQ